MDVLEKLSILTDAAKYDAACTSSGGNRSFKKGHIGNTSSSVAGCCHSFSADGRCVTLLKVLMTGVFPLAYLGIGICVILKRKKVQNETL